MERNRRRAWRAQENDIAGSMIEFHCKALSAWSSCDDQREKTFTHKACDKTWRLSQLDYILGPRMCKSTSYTQRSQIMQYLGSLPCVHYHTRRSEQVQISSSKEETRMGPLEAGQRGRHGKVQDEGDGSRRSSKGKQASLRYRTRLRRRPKPSTTPQKPGDTKPTRKFWMKG